MSADLLGICQSIERERSYKGILLFQSQEQICWPVTHHWLCSRGLKFAWETMKRYSTIILGTFAIGPSQNRTGDQESIFSPQVSSGKPGSRHTYHCIGCHAANFALGHYGWDEKPWRGIPGPFTIDPSKGIELVTPHITSIPITEYTTKCKTKV